ncbi:MAG TPA: radical SAM protein [Anaerolineae bacterium]|nr:radical SAM protein [Anaerolineae bacterium]
MLHQRALNFTRRYLTLKTDRIHALPIAILMPHSGCNCRCIMCDIWLGNGRSTQLTRADIESLLISFSQLHTEWVVLSGGEALMNPRLFEFCQLLKEEGLKISILSTGILLEKYAAEVVALSDETILSLDGPPTIHDAIRRIPRAYEKLAAGVAAVKKLDPTYHITARTVIQYQNYQHWSDIITTAHQLQLDGISFLPADTTSTAFNRPEEWDAERQEQVTIPPEELPQLHTVIEKLINTHTADFQSGYIAEKPDKLRRIHTYYRAAQGLDAYPPVQCNAPWVSAVVEADGTARPCFFHEELGNIHDTPLHQLINTPKAIYFRQSLDLDTNLTCQRCVCTLNLRPHKSLP